MSHMLTAHPERTERLRAWLGGMDIPAELQQIVQDAGNRRYYRFGYQGHNHIAVDAPPQTENNLGFYHLNDSLAQQGLRVPKIHAFDETAGFFWLSDFGNKKLLSALSSRSVEHYYQRAMDCLATLQTTHSRTYPLANFDSAFMHEELKGFEEWFCRQHVKCAITPSVRKILIPVYDKIFAAGREAPQVMIHRDYQSRNLMVLPDDKLGILDYQDAMRGPLTYDLASLLRDCYIDWPDSLIEDCLRYFYEACVTGGLYPGRQFEKFHYTFDMMTLQRHLKNLYIFVRKWHRDKDPRFLAYLPRMFNYVNRVACHYDDLQPFQQWLNDTIAPNVKGNP